MECDPDERVSIPLDPETALRALLKVDPDDPPAPDAEKQPEERKEDNQGQD